MRRETQPADVALVSQARRAAALLRAPRPDILARLAEPASASALAAQLKLPRQLVNYHVHELARAGFLRRAGRRRKRNMIEQQYRATARSYVLSPEILGRLGADPARISDRFSAGYLAALAARVQSEMGRSAEQSTAERRRLPSFSVDSEIRFESSEQRAAFATALRQALVEIIGRHASPAARHDGSPGSGSLFRLVVACYPIPKEK